MFFFRTGRPRRIFKVCLHLTTLITITVTLTGGIFDLFDGHCDGKNRVASILPVNVYNDGDGLAWCERTFTPYFLHW